MATTRRKKTTGTRTQRTTDSSGKTTTTKIRIYRPDKTFDKIYRDAEQLMKWRDYYNKHGIRTRKV